jgi:methylenetetrahydrofolate reductase (NADPH)
MMAAGMEARPGSRLARARALIAGASIELSPRDELAGAGLRDLFPPGTEVFVNHPASASCGDIVDACARLRLAGFAPVPHIAARRLASTEAAVDFLRRLTDEAEIDDVLLIGGDPAWPAGPFRDSLALLASGLVECHGIERVRFAGYPEGHPVISQRALDRALAAKLPLAQERGLAASLVTQFGFEAEPIARWVSGLRERGIDCPVAVGVAGPASVVTLAKFAVRCGIGSSLRALARGHTAFARILTEASPEALIDALVAGEADNGAVDSLHVFTFGGVRRTAEWRQQMMRGSPVPKP